jgi:hypothetical protein
MPSTDELLLLPLDPDPLAHVTPDALLLSFGLVET